MPIADEVSLTIPASTTKANAERSAKKTYPAGARLRFIGHIPSGHQGEVPWWVEFDGTKRLPTSQGEFRLDNVPEKPLQDGYITLDQTTEVEVVGYNEDAVNEHTVRVSILGLYRGER